MADLLELRIFTPQRQLLDAPAEQVTAQGTVGQFGVLPMHAAFLTTLDPGILTFRRPGGAEEKIAVKGGFAEVKDDVVTVLADEAVPVSEIDRGAAAALLRAAEAAVAEAAEESDAAEARRELRWAEVLAGAGA